MLHDCPISDLSHSSYVSMPQKKSNNFAGTHDVKKLKENKKNVNTNIDRLPVKPSTFKNLAHSTGTTQNPMVVGDTEQMKDPHSLKHSLDVSPSCDSDSTSGEVPQKSCY